MNSERGWDIFNNNIDVHNIFKIYGPQQRREESGVWPLTKHSTRTIKSAYKSLCKNNDDSSILFIKQKRLWKIHLPQRVLFFGWKCLNKAIQVFRLLMIKILVQVIYVLFVNPMQSLLIMLYFIVTMQEPFHSVLFLVSSLICFHVFKSRSGGGPYASQMLHIVLFLIPILKHGLQHFGQAVWKKRNELIYRGKEIHPLSTLYMAKIVVEEF